jgi:hypothetical protein
MAERASWSAEAVTVQVFKTTTSADEAFSAGDNPRLANCRSMDAPSAWVARHPKFSTKNVATLNDKPSLLGYAARFLYQYLPISK